MRPVLAETKLLIVFPTAENSLGEGMHRQSETRSLPSSYASMHQIGVSEFPFQTS